MNKLQKRGEYIDPKLACHERARLVELTEGQLTITWISK